jgi:hypothetical protein
MRKATVEHYLHGLEEELRDLPPARRRELLEDIREHIAEALAEIPEGEEAEVRNILDRVGEPAVIAEEPRERFGIKRVKPGIREILTLILLPLGGFFWVIGWAVGAILLATSQVWTSREKVIGLLVVPGRLLPAFPLRVDGRQVVHGDHLERASRLRVVQRRHAGLARPGDPRRVRGRPDRDGVLPPDPDEPAGSDRIGPRPVASRRSRREDAD